MASSDFVLVFDGTEVSCLEIFVPSCIRDSQPQFNLLQTRDDLPETALFHDKPPAPP
jgi:hypothetical protein